MTLDNPMHPHAHARLRGLAAQLEARRFEATMRDDSTLIALEPVGGDGPRHGDTIACHPRPEHDNRLWFFTGKGDPIAEVDDVDAVLRVAAHVTTATGVPHV